MDLSKEELARYHRQIILPNFGIEAQKKLKAAKVLVVGAGGLGCPLLLYLAAAGVGTIGIVDFDVVDESNLQRQVLYEIDDIGKPKVNVAKRQVERINTHLNIVTYSQQLTAKNALEIIRQYDVVADCSDNFPTRYLVNDACLIEKKVNVYASIFQFEGQVSVFNYNNTKGEIGPNYRDLFPTPPAPELVPNCAEGGVLGALPGIVGCCQANEVIKIIAGIGEPLSGRLFVFDALSFESRILNIIKRTNTSQITELINYEQFCGIKKIEKKMNEISVAEFLNWLKTGEKLQVIDVREPYEYEGINIEAVLIPLGEILDRSNEISRDKKVVIHCKVGARSARAIQELENKFGFNNLYNLKGGILAILQETDMEDWQTYHS